MERPSNIREALLADALGDLHKLLNRADKLVPSIDEARKAIDDGRKALEESRMAMVTTVRGMTAEVEEVKRQVVAEAEDTKKATLRYLGDNTKRLVAELVVMQTKAMSDTARSLVEKEVGPKLRDLAAKLEKQADRANDPWRDWLAHACTGTVSAVCVATVFLLSTYLSGPSGRPESLETASRALQGPAPEAKATSPAPPATARRERDKRPGGSESR